jgi:hypothetical protein
MQKKGYWPEFQVFGNNGIRRFVCVRQTQPEQFSQYIDYTLDYWTENSGSILGRGWNSSVHDSPDQLWSQPNLVLKGNRNFFPRGKAAGTQSWPLSRV